jgi:hypothetical protein
VCFFEGVLWWNYHKHLDTVVLYFSLILWVIFWSQNCLGKGLGHFLMLLAYFCQDRIILESKNSFHISPCINAWGILIFSVCCSQFHFTISFLALSLFASHSAPLPHLLHLSFECNFILFLFFGVIWGLNSGLCAYEACLPLEPHLQFFSTVECTVWHSARNSILWVQCWPDFLSQIRH